MATIKTKVIFLKELLALKEVVDAGKIQTAADNNGIKHSNLSKLISDLESRFNTQLLNRTGTGTVPTRQTNVLYSDIAFICDALDKLLNKTITEDTLTGTISVWIENGFLGTRFLHDMSRFFARYTKIKLIILTNPNTDLNSVDIVLIDKEYSPKISGKLLFNINVKARFFASLEYIQEHGIPKNMDDLLENFDLCMRQRSLDIPKIADLMKRAKHLNTISDSASVIYRLVQDGDGIALLPAWYVQVQPKLFEIPTLDLVVERTALCYYNDQNTDSKKADAFLKFMVEYCRTHDIDMDLL